MTLAVRDSLQYPLGINVKGMDSCCLISLHIPYILHSTTFQRGKAGVLPVQGQLSSQAAAPEPYERGEYPLNRPDYPTVHTSDFFDISDVATSTLAISFDFLTLATVPSSTLQNAVISIYIVIYRHPS